MNFKDLLDNQLEAKIKDLLKNGNKVEAIRIVQNQLKLGLKNSKNLVDAIEHSDFSQVSKSNPLN